MREAYPRGMIGCWIKKAGHAARLKLVFHRRSSVAQRKTRSLDVRYLRNPSAG